MKIEKFTASSMIEAMEKIQKKLGDDAVIYSQNKTDSGVEIIAGLPQENTAKTSTVKVAASPAESFLTRLKQADDPQLLTELEHLEKHNLIIRKLRKLHFPYHFCEYFADQYSSQCTLEAIRNNEIIIKILLSQLHITETEPIHIKKICALIGPTGIGKSTTIAKLARRFAAKFGTENVGIVSTDFQRIITKNQFHYFGKLLNIQIEYAKDNEALKKSMQLLQDKRLILIDTAGVNQNDPQKVTELFERFCDDFHGLSTYLVLPCNIQSEILDDVIRKFKMPHTAGCILTKMDEARSLAPALSVVMQHRLPVAYCCNGQNIINDIYVPTAAMLLKRVFEGESHEQYSDVSV